MVVSALSRPVYGLWTVDCHKHQNKKAHTWILATLVGFIVGSFLSFIVFSVVMSLFSSLVSAIEMMSSSKPGEHWYFYGIFNIIHGIATIMGAGMFIGTCQWISLKKKTAGSLKWSLVTGLGFVIGAIFAGTFGSLFSEASFILLTIIFSFIFGLVSGLFAEQLIIYPETQQQEIAS
ncbi:MAG: hypothetical protein ACOYZ8_08935 [Chloroflexota bacterium]